MASANDMERIIDESDITFGDKIGSGSFGNVFKVALKIKDGCVIDAAAKSVSLKGHSEIEVLSKLKHKHIITYYGVLRKEDSVIIITELASKGDLRSFLSDRQNDLDQDLMLRWVREAGSGIQYLHQNDYVHKDIKASNYLIMNDYTLKLSDFGTAGNFENTTGTRGHGTVRWMAPEVVSGQKRSKKSDIFSYGIVIYEITSRKIPFGNLQSRKAIMDAVVAGERPVIPKDTSEKLGRMTQLCWNENYKNRPTIDQALQFLDTGKLDDHLLSSGTRQKEVTRSDKTKTGKRTTKRPMPEKVSLIIQSMTALKDVMKMMPGQEDAVAKELDVMRALAEAKQAQAQHYDIQAKIARDKTMLYAERERKEPGSTRAVKLKEAKEDRELDERMKNKIYESVKMGKRNEESQKRAIAALADTATGEQTFRPSSSLASRLVSTTPSDRKLSVDERMKRCHIAALSAATATMEQTFRPSSSLASRQVFPTPSQSMLKSTQRIKLHDMDTIIGKAMNSEKLTEEKLRNLTRRTTLDAVLPDINILPSQNSAIAKSSESRSVTDVLQLKLIPSLRVAKRWELDLQRSIKEGPSGFYYYLQIEDLILDTEGIRKILTIHKALEIRPHVQEEYSWIQRPDVSQSFLDPVDPQEKPSSSSMEKYMRIIHNQQFDEIHEEFGMNACELAQICCSRKISGKHIQWIMKKLNETQSDVLCIHPAVESPSVIKKYMDDVHNAHAETPSTPEAMLFVFMVDGVQGKAEFTSEYKSGHHITLGLGTRFTLAYVNPSKHKVFYADSLGHPHPGDLLDTIALYYEAVYKAKMNSKIYDVVFAHDPLSTDRIGVHVCSNRCSTFYPLQRCHRLDGIVVSIISAIACLKPNLFHFLTKPQSTTSYQAARYLQHPTSYSDYLRRALLSWFGDESITIDYVTPKQFDCYQMFATYGPRSVEAVPPYCYHPLVLSTPGLFHILYPTPQEEPSERLNIESTKSVTRISTTCKMLPTLSLDVKGSIKSFPNKRPITNIFQADSIPDEITLRQWMTELQYCNDVALKDIFTYVIAENETYDEKAVQLMLRLHKAVLTKEEVKRELGWIEECHRVSPPYVVNQPRKESLKAFQSLVHYRDCHQILENYLLSSEELSQICCDRWVTTGHIEWILSQLNAIQKDVVAICLPPRDVSSLPYLASGEPKHLAVVLNVGLDENDEICTTRAPGWHTSFCYVDVSSKHMTYCDTLGWPPPKDMTYLLENSYEIVFGVPLPECEISCVHQPITNVLEDEHRCSSGCATYYPLQTCGSIAGVITIISAAIACLTPDFFRFLTEVHQISSNEAAMHFLQRPSNSATYLRLVIATWFAEKKINIGNVIPVELATFAPAILDQVPATEPRKLTTETIEYHTRAEITNTWLPESSSALPGVLTSYDTKKPVVDVFAKYTIPAKSLLHQWQEAIEESQETSTSKETPFVYYEVIDERYDTDCIDTTLRLHQVKRIQRRVHEELEWFNLYPIIQVHVTKLPIQKSLNKFKGLVHNNAVSDTLAAYNMTSDILADIVCDRQLRKNHVDWVLNRLNEMQSNVLCVQHMTRQGVDKPTSIQVSDSKPTPTTVLFVFRVVRTSDGVKIANDSERDTHFSVCHVSLKLRQVTYADSLGWPPPSDLIKSVEEKLKRDVGISVNSLEVHFCHDPDLTPDDEDVHICGRQFCAAYFPLQTSRNVGGVVASILAAIACLSPSYFNFLTKSNERQPLFSSLHLQRPHDVYLRQVLASWFARGQIDISNVLPKDLDTTREYSCLQ